MIQNKEDLRRYLEADKRANLFTTKRPRIFGDEIWRFLIAFRKFEYYTNTCNSLWGGWLRNYWHLKYHFYSILLGYSIPINVIDEGLRLFHRGTIIISRFAKIGKNAQIHCCVNIGQNKSREETPVIGDNCFIGPGAKLFGKIQLGNNIVIGANAVVNKSFTEDNVTIAGVPAKIINK